VIAAEDSVAESRLAIAPQPRTARVATDPIQVLLVEDSPDHADLIKQVLAEPYYGRRPVGPAFQVAHVERLAEALTRLDRGGVDVVLLDLHLPDSRGLETFAAAHTRAPSVPIVVFSALDDEELAARAVREGAQDYLVKGEIAFDLIARSIRYAIERKRAEAELLAAQAARAEAEAALRHARRLEKQRRQRQRQELRSLERLAAPRTTVTARVFGVDPLSTALPEVFHELVGRYARLIDLALEQRAYKVDHRLSDQLRSLADEIGFLNAGPRDVVELHATALKSRTADVAPRKAQAYIDEARVRVLELMGYLVAYYRS
jgi:CheY-like chemotaxis protein